jgi:hypothetical protein
MMRSLKTVLTTLVLALFCVGCGGSGGGPNAPVNKEPVQGAPAGTIPDRNPAVKTKAP